MQSSVLYVLGYTIGALVIADQWLDRWIDRDATAAKVAVTVAVGASVLLTAATHMTAARAAASAAAAEESAAAERARVAAEVRATIAGNIHAIVVEVVAAHQAVVRNAYSDDILTRLTSADDSAHAALASLDSLLAVEVKSSEPAGTPLPVA
jgi:hypothetical protein